MMKPFSLAWWFEDVPLKQAAQDTGLGPVYTVGETAFWGTSAVGTIGGIAVAGAAAMTAASVVVSVAVPVLSAGAVIETVASGMKGRR